MRAVHKKIFEWFVCLVQDTVRLSLRLPPEGTGPQGQIQEQRPVKRLGRYQRGEFTAGIARVLLRAPPGLPRGLGPRYWGLLLWLSLNAHQHSRGIESPGVGPGKRLPTHSLPSGRQGEDLATHHAGDWSAGGSSKRALKETVLTASRVADKIHG